MDELNALRKRAAQQGKQGVYIVKFPGFELECRISSTLGREYD